MKKLAISVALCTLFGTSFASHASLTASADGKTVYDSDLHLTWLADANYSKTSGYHTTGSMSWGAAGDWASNLNVEGRSDWQLPTIDQLSHLYQGIGGSLGQSISGNHNLFYDLFSNIQDRYWSSTVDLNNSSKALGLYFEGTGLSGYSFNADKGLGHFAMAVSAVPEPETYAMLLAGLGLLGWKLRRT